MNKREIGSKGESVASRYLISLGFTMLKVNYRCKYGEIDIIAKEGDTIAFVEVKARKNLNKGMPSEAVNYYKQKKIMKVAMYYAKMHGIYEQPMRFDIVEIVGNKIRLMRHAFIMQGDGRYL